MKIEIVNFYDRHKDNKPRHQALYIDDTFIVDWDEKYTEVNNEILETAAYRNFFLEDLKNIL